MDNLTPIVGYSNYFISESGEIYSKQKTELVLKKQTIGAIGYKVVSLWKENVGKNHYAHRLILECFIGPCPAGMEALHKNGNRLDNSISNLRWGTRKENVADAIRHGTATVGSKNGAAKLSRNDIGWLIDMRDMGFNAVESSKHFNVSPTTIRRVYTRTTYIKECQL